MESGWYADLISDLTGEFAVVETTDLNTDRARVVFLSRGIEQYNLALSLWGPFASVYSSGGSPQYLDVDELCVGLRRVLEGHAVELVKPGAIDATMRDADGTSRTVWEVMFCSGH